MEFKSLKFLGMATAIFLGGSQLEANASLIAFQSFNGNVGYSSDGFGDTSSSGVISASAPAGSTVLGAYLYSVNTYGTSTTPSVTLNATPVVFSPNIGSSTWYNFRSDVTGIVKPIIDAGAGGVYNFNLTESSTFSIDGEALVVVYSNPGLPEATVGILDGFSAFAGDSTAINFANPLNPLAPGFFAEMSLGIGFSCCNQKSTVMVNGTTITENAGNMDDGLVVSNGSLITVGGFDDPFSPLNPSYADDHERYNLVPYINAGDMSINIFTENPSFDDNIFLATFFVSGTAGFNEPPPTTGPVVPEPSSMLLLGAGIMGGVAFRKRLAGLFKK